MTPDERLTHLRAICLELPGAKEKTSHGSPVFFTTKTFCWWGAHVSRADRERGVPDDALCESFSFVPDADEREALVGDPRFFVPAYLGPSGWLAVDVSGRSGAIGWDEIAELVESSYRNTAGKRLIAQLDAR